MISHSTSLLTPREAAELLRISTRTPYSQTAPRGSLPCVKIGKSVRYSPESLRNWIDSKQEKGQDT